MTPEQAEAYLLSLELFGMRFGLDRMHRLMTALGNPQHAFGSIHVVGTNGKSSTARMLAAILARHGLRSGAYLSPHLISFTERIRIDDQDSKPTAFAAAVGRAARAAELVNRSLPADDCVTQFEALTAAAYSELATQGVEVAVIEAGLGGRYDATNVIPSTVQVLTAVGLEHTRWLGPTVRDIATEKLEVVRRGSVLVLGPDLHPDAGQRAEAIAAEREVRIVQAPRDPGADVEVSAPGTFQRRNFAVAMAAAEAYLGELDSAAVAAAGREVRVPGRLQAVDEVPLTLFDGAHNPDGMAALAEAVGEMAAGHVRLVAVVSILEDKDAAGMLARLVGICDALIFTSSQNPRALPPPTLESLARQLGGPPSEIVADPAAALRRGRELAGPEGMVLATGSIYLIADLLAPAGRRQASRL